MKNISATLNNVNLDGIFPIVRKTPYFSPFSNLVNDLIDYSLLLSLQIMCKLKYNINNNYDVENRHKVETLHASVAMADDYGDGDGCVDRLW